jgi:N-methylhydantoinase A
MRIAVDTGGTFNDCVFVRHGRLQILKVPSRPKMPEEAVVEAVRQALRQMDSPEHDAHLSLICGTTVGTNALLERRGGRVVLVTTAGFEDVLEIGRQARPKLYDFFVQKPDPLVPQRARMGAKERLAWDGSAVERLSDRELRRIVNAVQREQPEAVAVCFLFSFRNPAHEKQIARALRREGWLVSASHEILPEFREYERTSTTVINAYLAPVMSGYLARTTARVKSVWSEANRTSAPRLARKNQKKPTRSCEVRVMQSNGGIISAQQAAQQPVTTILSGPAGGVTGAAYAAELAGIEKVITFDMGGTSTDVALLSGELRTTTEALVAGVPVAVPMLEIHTVGAGGGSIARFDRGGALRVGPESAGAEPGPVCYGRGEQPTVTDAHAVLGHFGGAGLLGGEFALDVPQARKQMEQQLKETRGAFRRVEQFAEGILAVANAVMEKAIRVISVERGHDPRDYTLVAFGGAGGLHGCALGAALEMRGVLLPVFPGGLSALGILRADVVREFSRTVLIAASDLRETSRALHRLFRPLEQQAQLTLRNEGFAASNIRVERRLDMRYAGQAYELSVPATGDFLRAFHNVHEQRYGYHDKNRALEIVNVRCRAIGITQKPTIAKIPAAHRGENPPIQESFRCVMDGKTETARVFNRDQLRARHSFSGPAIIREYSATSLVPRNWNALVDSYGQILLRHRRTQ